MKTQNKVQLIGYVGDDPELRTLPSGMKKSYLRLATHVKSPEKENEWISVWHTIIAWEEHAQRMVDNFSKGSHILVEGSLHYRSFTDRNGQEKHVTEINTSHFLNLDR